MKKVPDLTLVKSESPISSVLVIDSVEGTITLTHPDGSEVVHKLPVIEKVVTKPLCNVGVSAQATYNMGNYESMKVSVSLHVPAEL